MSDEIKIGSTYRICETCGAEVEGMFKCKCVKERDRLQSELAEQQKLHERTRKLRNQEIEKLRSDLAICVEALEEIHNYGNGLWTDRAKEALAKLKGK